MANYCLTNHIRMDLGSNLVTDLAAPAIPVGETEETYLEFLLENAEGEINAVLNKWHDTPIVTDQSNNFLRSLTLKLAIYELWSKSLGDDIPTKHKDSYEKALMTLEDIQTGDLKPFGDEINNDNSSLIFYSDDTVFTEDDLSKYF